MGRGDISCGLSHAGKVNAGGEATAGGQLPFKAVATGAQKFPKNAHWKDKIKSNTMRRESRPELLRFDHNN